MCDKVTRTDSLIKDYLKSNNVFTEKKSWEIRLSPLAGRGIFASRDIYPGELIFVDCPIIIGPRACSISSDICVICYKNYDLVKCSKNCGLPVCSRDCENSDTHRKECAIINSWKKRGEEFTDDKILQRCLAPVRSLFLSERDKNLVKLLKFHDSPNHGFEVDALKTKFHFNLSADEETFLRFVCSVLDANAFEVVVGNEIKQSGLRGLYPLSSLANHNCSPNTTHVFDNKQRMLVRAAVFIPKDAEIFHSYVRLIWGTLARRYLLYRTKHFLCACERCCDPSEFGGNLSALTCQHCEGLVLPCEPLQLKTTWKCTKCAQIVPDSRVSMIFSVFGSRVQSLDSANDIPEIFNFLDGKLIKMVAPSNQIAVELKYKLVWILGYTAGYLWEELSDEYLQRKEAICVELLDILQRIRTGMCKMRGLLLYERFLCLREKQKRTFQLDGSEINNNEISEIPKIDQEMQKLFDEASNILMFDVDAPQEMKQKWPKINGALYTNLII